MIKTINQISRIRKMKKSTSSGNGLTRRKLLNMKPISPPTDPIALKTSDNAFRNNSLREVGGIKLPHQEMVDIKTCIFRTTTAGGLVPVSE
jgi:hypothetical protein